MCSEAAPDEWPHVFLLLLSPLPSSTQRIHTCTFQRESPFREPKQAWALHHTEKPASGVPGFRHSPHSSDPGSGTSFPAPSAPASESASEDPLSQSMHASTAPVCSVSRPVSRSRYLTHSRVTHKRTHVTTRRTTQKTHDPEHRTPKGDDSRLYPRGRTEQEQGHAQTNTHRWTPLTLGNWQHR